MLFTDNHKLKLKWTSYTNNCYSCHFAAHV